MKYTYENKVYNVPDEEIDRHVEQLGISISEACELYLTDHDLITNEVVEELEAKGRKNRITATIHQAKGEKKPRKAREKKENPLKKQIINDIFMYFITEGDWNSDENYKITVRNPEKYIDLVVNGREFTINLIEHRKKKE